MYVCHNVLRPVSRCSTSQGVQEPGQYVPHSILVTLHSLGINLSMPSGSAPRCCHPLQHQSRDPHHVDHRHGAATTASGGSGSGLEPGTGSSQRHDVVGGSQGGGSSCCCPLDVEEGARLADADEAGRDDAGAGLGQVRLRYKGGIWQYSYGREEMMPGQALARSV